MVLKVELAEIFNVVAAKLVEVMLAAEILVGVKFVALNVVKKPLVDVMLVASKIVEVIAVPEALVKNNGPVKVPPARGR